MLDHGHSPGVVGISAQPPLDRCGNAAWRHPGPEPVSHRRRIEQLVDGERSIDQSLIGGIAEESAGEPPGYGSIRYEATDRLPTRRPSRPR